MSKKETKQEEIIPDLQCKVCKKKIKTDKYLADFVCNFCIRYEAMVESFNERSVELVHVVENCKQCVERLDKENKTAEIVIMKNS